MTTLQAEFEALMPEAVILLWQDHPSGAIPVRGYTADQMRAMFDAATERAAKLSADLANDAAIKYAGGYPVDFEQEVAAAIRGTP
ncbi:hypothetical protein QFZ42_003360 [Variovorax paradoxus]|uniref:hypothetical protein n=1 Tax=Variovorax paradoxus TaxID=34073 RepID=UPI0027947E84|nr:hypothetical protein [Variovorax paradoxus]MDQ0571526.1 hypothetical protein [Variovorax paradoxus]